MSSTGSNHNAWIDIPSILLSVSSVLNSNEDKVAMQQWGEIDFSMPDADDLALQHPYRFFRE